MVDMDKFKMRARAKGAMGNRASKIQAPTEDAYGKPGPRSETATLRHAARDSTTRKPVHPNKIPKQHRVVVAKPKSLHGKELAKVDLTRYEQLVIGQLSFKDLDDKEVFLRCTREWCDDGTMDFPEKAPVLNRKMLEGFDRELMARVHGKIRKGLLKSFDVVMHVLESPSIEPQHRLRAAELFINRALGKPRETVDMNVATPYDNLLREYLEMKIEREKAAEAVEKQAGDSNGAEIIDAETWES